MAVHGPKVIKVQVRVLSKATMRGVVRTRQTIVERPRLRSSLLIQLMRFDTVTSHLTLSLEIDRLSGVPIDYREDNSFRA